MQIIINFDNNQLSMNHNIKNTDMIPSILIGALVVSCEEFKKLRDNEKYNYIRMLLDRMQAGELAGKN